MANQQSDVPNSASADTSSRSSAPADTPVEQSDRQIAELRTMMADLLRTFQEVQVQNSRDAQFREAAAAIQDMRVAARSMVAAPPPPVAEYVVTNSHALPAERDGDCACGCVSERCCCFDIELTSVRVLAMQPLELDDSNANPFGDSALTWSRATRGSSSARPAGATRRGARGARFSLTCCSGVTPTSVFDVSLTSGGQGGGAIEVTFTAIPVCC